MPLITSQGNSGSSVLNMQRRYRMKILQKEIARVQVVDKIIIDLWDDSDLKNEDSLSLISKIACQHLSVWLCSA
jgi:hypothetical protein